MIKTYKDLLKKVQDFKINQNLDLSSGEDLSIGIMNLIGIEEHLFFTYGKTKDSKYLELLDEIRLMRTGLLGQIIKNYEGEVWCISKHLLAASMRLMEVGTKELKKKNIKEAEELFNKAYKLYSLFWGLNLGVAKISNSKSQMTNKQSLAKSEFGEFQMINDKNNKTAKVSVFSRLSDLVQKAIDCCRE